jgi:ABC-type branched-subunit amino acid transport system substrate-binding protein
VGNAAATSGPFAAVGVPFNEGMLAYFHMVNEAGGVHGRRIEFVHHDDGFDPVTGLAFTEQLIHDDRVFAIVGHFGTPTIGATLDLLKETGIPAVYFAAGIGALFKANAHTVAEGRNPFPVQPSVITEGLVLVGRAVEEYNAQRIGVIFSSDDAGHDLLSGINLQASRLPGVTVISEAVAPAQADVSSAVLRMLTEDVDVVIVATLQATLPIVVNAIVAAGLDVPVFTSYISADAVTLSGFVADYVGAGATFPIYATAWLDIGEPPDFTPEYMEFAVGVAEYGQPDLAVSAFAMAGWIAGGTFVQGLRNMDGNDFSCEAFYDAMEAAPINLPMGGVMDFSNGQRTGTQAMALVRANMEEVAWETVRPIEPLSEVLRRVEG